MNPDDNNLMNEIDLENMDVDMTEYEKMFFAPTDEEQEIETEIALAIDSLMHEYDN